MKPLILAWAWCAAVLMLMVPGLSKGQDMSAEQAVEQYVGSILQTIVDVQPLFERNREQYFAEVGSALEDFIDFREAARGVMAKYSQGPDGASPEQLDRFAQVFKASMIDFYGSALAAYDGEEFDILPAMNNGRADTADVRMALTTRDNARVELQYSMYVAPDGRWKMRNLYLEGVNLRRQYHSRFDSMMSHYRNIDAVIDNWESE